MTRGHERVYLKGCDSLEGGVGAADRAVAKRWCCGGCHGCCADCSRNATMAVGARRRDSSACESADALLVEREVAVDVIARFNDEFNRHDVEAVMELMTDDVVFENTSGGRFEGQESVRAVLARAFELMSSGWFETEQTIALGDHVVVLWAYAFDKQNRERGQIRGADIFRVRDGRVAEKLSYVKSEDFVQKLGLQITTG
jgi:ketosteroid isomerase-like protein